MIKHTEADKNEIDRLKAEVTAQKGKVREERTKHEASLALHAKQKIDAANKLENDA